MVLFIEVVFSMTTHLKPNCELTLLLNTNVFFSGINNKFKGMTNYVPINWQAVFVRNILFGIYMFG